MRFVERPIEPRITVTGSEAIDPAGVRTYRVESGPATLTLPSAVGLSGERFTVETAGPECGTSTSATMRVGKPWT